MKRTVAASVRKSAEKSNEHSMQADAMVQGRSREGKVPELTDISKSKIYRSKAENGKSELGGGMWRVKRIYENGGKLINCNSNNFSLN